jgi:hypothetical protein
MNIFGFKSKKGEVLDHWIGFSEGFSYSSQEFYGQVEKEISARALPSMDICRVDFTEGGMLSGKRTYLRMIRERLTCDACAAPFGNVYFFSCRTVYIPPVINILHILVLLILFTGIFGVFLQLLGPRYAVIAIVTLPLALFGVFRAAVAQSLSDLDKWLIRLPILGDIYEIFFRKQTYYREDTRILFLKILPEIIRELADEILAAKGLKLTKQYERAPILGELYKPI